MKNKKSKAEITKIIVKSILISGGVVIASTNPIFGYEVLPKLLRYAGYKMKNKKKEQKIFYDTFTRLRNKELIKMEYRGKQIHISLTEEGRKYAGKYQIDDLEIEKPKKWDKKWHVLVFDIDDKHKAKREALRGKIIELGLYQLQKSVWVCPYNFQKESDILKNFFGLTDSEMKIITASKIENDIELRKHFSLKYETDTKS